MSAEPELELCIRRHAEVPLARFLYPLLLRPLLKPRTSSFTLVRRKSSASAREPTAGAHGGQGARARTATGHRRREEGCDAGDHAGRLLASWGSHPAMAADSTASPDHRWARKQRKAKGRRHVARGAGDETSGRQQRRRREQRESKKSQPAPITFDAAVAKVALEAALGVVEVEDFLGARSSRTGRARTTAGAASTGSPAGRSEAAACSAATPTRSWRTASSCSTAAAWSPQRRGRPCGPGSRSGSVWRSSTSLLSCPTCPTFMPGTHGAPTGSLPHRRLRRHLLRHPCPPLRAHRHQQHRRRDVGRTEHRCAGVAVVSTGDAALGA